METNQKKNMMFLVGGGLLVVVVIVVVIVLATSGKKADSGSVIVNGTKIPTSPGPTTVIVNVTTPPAPQALVKTVLLERPSDQAINIADILLYDDLLQLIPSSNITGSISPQLANDLANYPAGFGPSSLLDNNTGTFGHTNNLVSASSSQNMKLVLTNPMKIKRIVIMNRLDCCQDRIATVSVKTLDSNNVQLSKYVLTGASMKYELNYDPSSGAFGNVVPS